MMKELKLSKILLMAFGAPLEIVTLLRENKQENGQIGIECVRLYNQKLQK